MNEKNGSLEFFLLLLLFIEKKEGGDGRVRKGEEKKSVRS
jgi:hypothetical protein